MTTKIILTEEEVNAELTKQLNDPNLLKNLANRDISRLSSEELLKFYEAEHLVIRILFGDKR
jgi:hypothetical protein